MLSSIRSSSPILLFLFLLAFIQSSAVFVVGRLFDLEKKKNNNANANNGSQNLHVQTAAAEEKVSTAAAVAAVVASKVNARKNPPPSLSLSSSLSSKPKKSLCERIRPIPDECSCREPGSYNLIVECLKTFRSSYFNDTIGLKIDVDPCNDDGSKVSIDVTEKDHNIDYPIAGIRAGESKNVPIPGLSVEIPTVGHAGLDAAVLVVGNPDKLKLKIGLNACAELTSHQICASSIPGMSSVLPWYVLSGTYSFGDICDDENKKNGIDDLRRRRSGNNEKRDNKKDGKHNDDDDDESDDINSMDRRTTNQQRFQEPSTVFVDDK